MFSTMLAARHALLEEKKKEEISKQLPYKLLSLFPKLFSHLGTITPVSNKKSVFSVDTFLPRFQKAD